MLGQVSALVLFLLACSVAAQTAPQYGQCGGIGWSGATLCPSDWSCSKVSDYYSQCLPGAASAPGPGSPSATTSAVSSSETLQPGYSFIRAVVDPNFHKYLQSEVLSTASDAVLGDPDNAAQFQITNGQLIQDVNGSPLYAVVTPPADSTVKLLKVTWYTEPDTLGTFVFSGDTVEWSSPNVSRPQNNAWLVCPDDDGHRDVYINLGPYSYNTPAGCADQTIHGYTGSTATP